MKLKTLLSITKVAILENPAVKLLRLTQL